MAEHDEPTIEQLNDEADIAADYLEGLLDVLDYEGDIEMGVRNGRAVVQIVADDDTDIRNLTGKDGEVVEALQRLTRLAVQQKTGDRSRLILDVDGFLKKKRAGLNEIAMDAIDEARSTGEPVDLDPMNSFERKIVHDVARTEGMKSRSHGEEPHRYVTVYVRGSHAASQTDVTDNDEEYEDDILGDEDNNDADQTRDRAGVTDDSNAYDGDESDFDDDLDVDDTDDDEVDDTDDEESDQ